jgi:cytochrome c5
MTIIRLGLLGLALSLLTLPAIAMHHGCMPMHTYRYWSPPRAESRPQRPPAEDEQPDASLARGRDVFEQVCSACHLRGFAGAPRIGDKTAWADRIEEGEAVLLEHALLGYRRMPPRGMCRSCSRQDLADAIAYMVERSQ